MLLPLNNISTGHVKYTIIFTETGLGLLGKSRMEDVKWFVQVYKEILVDCFKQNRHDHISSLTDLLSTEFFNLIFRLNFIFTLLLINILIRVRIGASEIHSQQTQIFCPRCSVTQMSINSDIDDEMHFVFE